MERRNGRRRRVLREESRVEQASAVAEEQVCGVSGYNDSALSQPSLTDLIPVRPIRILTLVLAWVSVLLGLLLLDDWAAEVGGVAAFELSEPGSLASWVASTLLMASAFGALLTYLIRRHRRDDYRGAYHVWLWAACAFVFASVAATSQWHLGLQVAMARLTAVDLGDHGWWLATAGAAAGLMLLRLAVEIRKCRLALLLLIIAGTGYVAATMVETGVLLQQQRGLHELACNFGVLVSHLVTACAIWWNARFVQLDAQGVHAARAEERERRRLEKEQKRQQRREQRMAKTESAAQASDDAAGDEATEAEPKAKTTRSRKTKASSETAAIKRKPTKRSSKPKSQPEEPAPVEAKPEMDDADDAPSTLSLEENRKQTKSERRKQRKQKRRMAA